MYTLSKGVTINLKIYLEIWQFIVNKQYKRVSAARKKW